MTRSSRWLGSAALAIAVIISACQAPAPTPGGSVTTVAPATTGPPTTSPTALPTPTHVSISWSRVEDPDFADEVGGVYSMTSVAASAAGFVAVGQGPTSSMAWVSADGQSWDRADPEGGFGHHRVEQVVAIDGGFLAVGRSETGAGVSWTSTDGRAWNEPITLPGLEEGLITHVAALERGVLAVGYSLGDTKTYQFWISADGRSWRRPASAPIARVEPGIAVAVSDAEYLVIGSPVSTGRSAPSLWTSADGETWTEHSTNLGPGLLPVALASGSSGIVASFLDPERGLVAHSVDGRSWQPHSLGAVASLLAAIPGGFLAAREDIGVKDLWTSSQGTEWHPIEDLRPFARSRLLDVTVRGETIVAVGDIETSTDLISASAWINLAVASATGPPAVVPPCPQGSVEVHDLLAIDATARLTCFGNRSITFVAYLPTPSDACAGTGIEPHWLRGCAVGVVVPQAAPGNSVGLPARLHPSTGLDPSTIPADRWVLVTGHHDDPAAATCREIPSAGVLAEPRAVSVLECRKQFVITEMTEAESP